MRFVMQRAANEGWVFAKSDDGDIFLFGETPEGVVAQMDKAVELLRMAKHRDALQLAKQATRTSWTPMPAMAACG